MNSRFAFISVVYLLLDLAWIRFMSPRLYRPVFSAIQKTNNNVFRLNFAVLAYMVLLGVLRYICVPLSQSSMYNTVPWLAFTAVGFALYSVFNLTNAVVFTNYPLSLQIIDTLWGTTVFSILGILYSRK